MSLSIAGAGALGPAGLDVSRYYTATVTAKRWATRTFATPPEDDTPNVIVQGRFSPPNIQRTIGRDSQGLFATTAVSTVGDLTLANEDGGLDDFGDAYEAAHRAIRLRVGGSDAQALSQSTAATSTTWVNGSGQTLTWTYDSNPAHVAEWSLGKARKRTEFSLVFRGTVATASHEDGRVRIRVQDPSSRLRRPISTGVYSGAGGVGGGSDLAGRSKPMVFGTARNAPGTLTDSGRLIYHFHDGALAAIEEVYDGGVPLQYALDVKTYEELEALEQGDRTAEVDGDIYPGEYATCRRAGYIRLGGQPAGRITADVRGSGVRVVKEVHRIIRRDETYSDGTLFSDGTGWVGETVTTTITTYAGTVPSMILRLLEEVAQLGSDEVDRHQLTQLDLEEDAEAGLFVGTGETVTVEDACQRLAASMAAILLPDLLGRYRLLPLEPPAPGWVATLTPVEIVSLQREPLPYSAPWTRWRLGYAPNWTVLSENEIFPAAALDHRQFALRDRAYTEAFDSRAVVLYPGARTAQIDGLLLEEAAARKALARLQAFYAMGRSLFSARVKGMMFRLDLMDTVRVIHPRYGLSTGRNFVVVQAHEQAESGLTDLLLFG